jgi:acyl carrier protein
MTKSEVLVIEILAKNSHKQRHEITPQLRLDALDFDSLQTIMLLLEITESLGRTAIRVDDLPELETVGDLLAMVSRADCQSIS